MTETECLPLIETIAAVFPDEWLAFIISPEEDDDYEPLHGKLIVHSPDPDDVYDAVNTVLWNQHIYVFFNGDFEVLKASYRDQWGSKPEPIVRRSFSGPKPGEPAGTLPASDPLPNDLIELIYNAIDHLYGTPNLSEVIRRLRLARVRVASIGDERLTALLDQALDQIEGPLPRINEVIWHLEEGLANLELA